MSQSPEYLFTHIERLVQVFPGMSSIQRSVLYQYLREHPECHDHLVTFASTNRDRCYEAMANDDSLQLHETLEQVKVLFQFLFACLQYSETRIPTVDPLCIPPQIAPLPDNIEQLIKKYLPDQEKRPSLCYQRIPRFSSSPAVPEIWLCGTYAFLIAVVACIVENNPPDFGLTTSVASGMFLYTLRYTPWNIPKWKYSVLRDGTSKAYGVTICKDPSITKPILVLLLGATQNLLDNQAGCFLLEPDNQE